MDIIELLLLAALILGMALLGMGGVLWVMKKAGIEPPVGLYWKIYRERFTGQADHPAWSGSRRSGGSGASRELWSRSAAWYIVPRKCGMLSVEAVVSRGHATLEIYGDQGLLRTWESWEAPRFTVDLEGVKRVRFRLYAEGFTGSVCCAGRRQPAVASKETACPLKYLGTGGFTSLFAACFPLNFPFIGSKRP